MAAERKWVRRHGKTNGWGYDQRGDEFRIAPCYDDEFTKLGARQDGLNRLIRSVSAFVAEQSAIVSGEQRALWDRVTADLGIDLAEYEANYRAGVVTRTKRKPVESAPSPGRGGSA